MPEISSDYPDFTIVTGIVSTGASWLNDVSAATGGTALSLGCTPDAPTGVARTVLLTRAAALVATAEDVLNCAFIALGSSDEKPTVTDSMTNWDLGADVSAADDVTVTLVVHATDTKGSECNALGIGVAVVCEQGAAVAADVAEPIRDN